MLGSSMETCDEVQQLEDASQCYYAMGELGDGVAGILCPESHSQSNSATAIESGEVIQAKDK